MALFNPIQPTSFAMPDADAWELLHESESILPAMPDQKKVEQHALQWHQRLPLPDKSKELYNKTFVIMSVDFLIM